ncbi:ABC transporter ATP-binding protein [Desnuesiella massiliensis]|uniref:ABC transporter ATP-binding protein n=1 Tax=Desnuesiella massiliensis TaxID=1650662 RepID=UPI0006E310C7|nr:ABC transporter ATP-binding protein [Desnuesiella massiliensis]
MSLALCVNNLTKNYGNFTAVNSLSLEVKEGEIFGILGPNGAGKTTTLECIEGVKSFDKGTINIFGENVMKNKNIYKLIGVQLQSTSLQGNMTVVEAMTLFCKWQKVAIREDLLEIYGLKDCYKKQYSTLSAGQKRRLHLALATAHNPKLIILDEPTAGLDVEGRINLHNEIRKLKEKGATIILASHDMAEVEALCDRMAIIFKGKIAATGTPYEVSAAGKGNKKVIVKTLNSTLLNNKNYKYSSVEEISQDYITLIVDNITEGLNEIIQVVKEKQDIITDIKVEGTSLEERFIEIINTKREVI